MRKRGEREEKERRRKGKGANRGIGGEEKGEKVWST